MEVIIHIKFTDIDGIGKVYATRLWRRPEEEDIKNDEL